MCLPMWFKKNCIKERNSGQDRADLVDNDDGVVKVNSSECMSFIRNKGDRHKSENCSVTKK